MTMPLHERIRTDYESRILSGELAPGDRLPIEQDLMQQYGCSRMTVNKALSALALAGLIDRRKKAGTFVSRPKLHSMILDIPDIASLIASRGDTYGYRPIVQKRRAAAAGRDDEKGLAGNGELLQVDGLHAVNGRTFGVEYRLVNIAAVPDIATADFSAVSPGSWLLEHVPWTEAETRISAVGANAEEAAYFDASPGTPCICIERHTWRGAERITYVRQVFMGDAYDLVARFGPGLSSRERGS